MAEHAEEFSAIVSGMLARFFRQNERESPSVAVAAAFAARLYALIAERGLPRPLAPHELGAPGGMSDEELAPLVARVAEDTGDALWADAAKQLVKACFYPEFKTCRNSFREKSDDGVCRRQQLPRARRRLSGVHCVDCPHWTALTPAQHERFLLREWCASAGSGQEGAQDFRAHRDVFLPEDFRALRRWLHHAARREYAR